MNQQGARHLAAQIEREPGWRAKTICSRLSHAWMVKAWAVQDDGVASETIFTTPFQWYYLQLKLAATVRRVKSLRLAVQWERTHNA